MDALERLSNLWLVGKMVQELFETVLAFDGFKLRLKQKADCESHHQLAGVEFEVEGLAVEEGSSSESHTPDKALKSLALTPSFVAHMDAALKSAAKPGKFEGSTLASSKRPFMEQVKGSQRQNVGPLVPCNDDYAESRATFMDDELAPTPGLNVVEWSVDLSFITLPLILQKELMLLPHRFQFFGIQ